MERAQNKGINANTIKIIAIIAMVIDHITWDYIYTDTLAGQLLHVIGRLTAPIMSFFIVEGFFHTRNLRKYVLRMFVFSILSYFAFQFHKYGEFFYGIRNNSLIAFLTNSVIFSLLLGLITLIIWYKSNWKTWMKIAGVAVCCILSMTSDWNCMAVLWVFFMGYYYGNFQKQMVSLAIIGVFLNLFSLFNALFQGNQLWWTGLCQYGVVLAIPVLYFYNGKLGKSKNLKWLFYIFYPLHLMILGYIRFYLW